MKKVLVILPNGNGGAERQSVRIASYLPVERFRVEYVIVGPSADKVGELIPDGAKLHLIRLWHIWQGGIFRIWRLFRREKPDVVFSSFHYLNGRMILAAMLAGVGHTVIRGNVSYKGDGDAAGRMLVRWLYRRASAVICQTDELRDECIADLGVMPGRAVTLNNIPDYSGLSAKAEDSSNPYSGAGPHFVNVARVDFQKGQDILLKAFLSVKRHHPDATLHIVGDIPDNDAYVQSLRASVRDNALSDCVFFTGYCRNPVPYMKFADCFVLTSRWEGLPNALVEAQYLGVPCVASNCISSMSKIVSEGINGFIVPCEDAAATAEAMEQSLRLRNVPYTYRGAVPADFVKCFESE
ncbi:MAG: glycosyltransferase [Bacteroidales bacterium]|nr:glycosyltransferase [Bacteroidales bacterium]